ncbi:zinc-binding oxidoreductase-like protein CipB [Hyaloscypha variabilis]
MSSITENQAAWIITEKTTMKVGPAPMVEPGEGEVLIEVAYAAVNPADWKIQDYAPFPLPYPFVFGTDVAGTITKVGDGVARFSIGQRVIAHCDSLLTQKPERSGYQRFTVCREILVAAVPDNIPLANAAVLPLSISTASTGLFKHLKIPFPTLDPKPTGKTILIWGGSSSCGASAIQLAVAGGVTVITTASPRNFDLVKSLGATQAFDHNSPTVGADILKVMKKGDLVFDCISSDTTQVISAEIVHQLGGGKLAVLLSPNTSSYEDVEVAMVNGLDPGLVDLDIGDAVWRNYIPAALAAGKFQAKPDPEVLEGGLDKVQAGIDMLRKGVSARKVVIEISKHA